MFLHFTIHMMTQGKSSVNYPHLLLFSENTFSPKLIISIKLTGKRTTESESICCIFLEHSQISFLNFWGQRSRIFKKYSAPCLGIASLHTVQFGLSLPCREIQDPWILNLVMILTSVMDWYLPDSFRYIYLFLHFETSRILGFFIVSIIDNECKVLISSHEKENISVRQDWGASVFLIMSNNGYIVGFVDIYKLSCLFCSAFWIISEMWKSLRVTQV